MVNIPARVLLFTLGPTALALLLTAWGTGVHRRVLQCRGDFRRRARVLAPFAAVLLAVLLFNAYVRPRADAISPAFGIRLTDELWGFDGSFVPTLQEVVPEPMVLYFAVVYVVGYALLLCFPPLAYAVLDDLSHAKTLLAAYSINYLVGSLVYIVVYAYGPRNVLVASGRLYESFPEVMFLTGAVNTSSNVFPSLHTSLAVTVLLLAYYSRREYPVWFAISAIVAPSVVVATMVLGIHWFADVVAGIVLAGCSVGFARWFVPRVQARQRQHDRRPTEQPRL